jgi:hypothetical protein
LFGDGGTSDTVRDCVTAAVVLGGMTMFRLLQLACKGRDPLDVPGAAHVIATVPANPPLGVTVIGIITVFGVVPGVAIIVPLPPLTVNEPVLAGFTVKVTLFEVPPAVVTVTPGVPAAAMSLAGTVTVISVGVVAEGVSAGLAPKFTVAPATKFVPLIFNTNEVPPAVFWFGEIDVIVGAIAAVTVTVAAVDGPAPA